MSKRKVSVDDIVRYGLIVEVDTSPEGELVAYSLRKGDMANNTYRSCIWAVSTSGGEPKKLTGGPLDQQPAWSPDGSQLAFVSNRSGSAQIWLLPRSGGEARQLTCIPSGVSGPVWSPDGTRIAFTSRTTPPGYVKPKADVRVITRIHYKNEEEFLDDKWSHIWVVNVKTGQTRQLTDGEYEESGPAWSPDGQFIAFCARRTDDCDYEVAKDVWLVNVEDKSLRQLTQEHQGPAASPSFSPDGQTVAFIGHDQHRDPGVNNMTLMTVPWDGGKPTNIIKDADISLGNDVLYDLTLFRGYQPPVWTADGQGLFTVATLGGTVHVLRVNRVSGTVERITGQDRVVCSFSLDKGRQRLVFAITDPSTPADIYLHHVAADHSYPPVAGYISGTSFEQDETGDVRLTEVNKDLLEQLVLVQPERIVYEGANGDWDIEGWILKPADFSPPKKYPMVLYVHGGPSNAYGYAFFHEFQLLCAQGWVVLITNPRGSRGYGEEFAHAVHMAWGKEDYEDIMKGVDHALSLGYIDEDNMACAGGSYGGFMTNWVVGSTNRFKVACTQRSLSNRHSFFGTCDVGYTAMRSYGDGPWALPEEYLEHSPIRLIGNATTPLLIIHSEEDRRCPIEQAEQVYAALKARKQEVVFCRYWGENHNLSRGGKPVNRVDRLERIIAWFRKYLPHEAE